MVIHMGVVRNLPFGSDATLTTTLCGRFRGLSDGMNLTTSKEEVTCKLCLRRLELADRRRDAVALLIKED